jgi:endonuclease-8
MPEGPSLVILKELTQDFVGRKILHAEGNSKIDISRIQGHYIKSLRTWGKHFLIELSDFSIRIHLLMFGSYRINERRESSARLSLQCSDNSELNFYACSVKFIEGDLDDTYDWAGDVMSDSWNPAAARKKLRALPHKLACDALLDQDIFAGVGNIIKNEVLFRVRIHPLSLIGALPEAKLRTLVDEARNYSFEFLEWKKAFVLKKHWLAHNKRICPRCNIPFKRAHLGATHRRSFYCENCQKKYS